MSENITISELLNRKSVRVFTEREISAEEKAAILEAAVQAPTAGNQQLYTILDITDPEIKEHLAESCDHQPFIASAKMVLIFCADCRKWYQAYLAGGCKPRKPDVGDFLLAVSDANIAAQNAVTAAWSLGIGSCYIGDIMECYEEHRELLSLPEAVFPAAMLVFGFPTEQQMKREKPARVPMEFVVHENRYQEPDPRNMFAQKSEDFDDWIQKFCERKYNSDFAREMSRSVRAFLSTLGADPLS